MRRLFGRASGSAGSQDGEGGEARTQAARERQGRRGVRSRGPPDPFGIHGALFEYLTHVEQHAEAFAGYRVKGNPMVLLSLVDGTALAAVHLRMVGGRGRALMARRPGENGGFQGVLAAEGRAFELVMTNLTTDTVLMVDIGGELRHIEPEFWGKSDKSFWSGRHRNDRRLNRSNIVWPMSPSVCDENNLHYQETGVSRRLQLLASCTSGVDVGGGGAEEMGFPVFVYPKHGSRASARFERTTWACPEAVVVLGSPQLAGDNIEEYNIQRDNPLNRNASGGHGDAEAGVVGALANSLGVTPERLLEVAQVDASFISQLPPEMAHEVLMRQLDEQKFQTLLEEGAPADKEAPKPSVRRCLSSQSASSPSASSAAPGEQLQSVLTAATPATVVAGERMLRVGGHNLLIERFDFERCSQATTLWFAVHEQLQISDDAVTEEEVAAMRADLHGKIKQLCSGRREALLEQICSVYETPECVICLSEKPDAVLYQCGHRCVHVKCIETSGLRRCPLCRAPIAAVLPEASAAS